MSHRAAQSRGLRYTGMLRKLADGTYGGQLMDELHGWPIDITAVVAEDKDGRFFQIAGELGKPPPALRIPLLDGDDA